ncbi:hypothetical protein BGX28_007597 [Mortierella sp. GBA30]|nr:hypothetical protein BGX28_007597 [Mortierella sp. GBA30]
MPQLPYSPLDIVVTRKFSPPATNPLRGVTLDVGMVVQISGTLSPQYAPGLCNGAVAYFHLEAQSMTRDSKYAKKRQEHEDQMMEKYTVPFSIGKNYGGFSC